MPSAWSCSFSSQICAAPEPPCRRTRNVRAPGSPTESALIASATPRSICSGKLEVLPHEAAQLLPVDRVDGLQAVVVDDAVRLLGPLLPAGGADVGQEVLTELAGHGRTV